MQRSSSPGAQRDAGPSGNPCPPPYLLLAHHRSGSNFLNDLLQSHPLVECLNEPLSMHTALFRQVDLERWTASQYRDDPLHPALSSRPALTRFLRELRDYLLVPKSPRQAGFKETVLFGKLGWVRAFLPGLRIVWLRRDERAIVSSVLRSGLMPLWRYRELVRPAFLRRWPDYESRVDPADTRAFDTETAAMSVALREALALEELRDTPHCVTHLEGLLGDSPGPLERLMAFLGLQAHPSQVDFMERRSDTHRGQLFSSFRRRDDVAQGWRDHLDDRQLRLVAAVMHAARTPLHDRTVIAHDLP